VKIIILIILIIGISVYLKKRKYDNSNYKKESGNEFKNVWRDKGNYGEYLTFNELEKISNFNTLCLRSTPGGNKIFHIRALY